MMRLEDSYWVFALGMILLYGFTVLKDTATTFFMTAILFFMYIHTRQSETKVSYKSRKFEEFWNDLDQKLSKKDVYVTVNSNRYDFYKYPKKVFMIHRHPAIKKIIYSVNFVQFYNITLLLDITSLTETFLKKHFEAMIDKREVETTWSTLNGMRRDLINMMHRIVFDTPLLPMAALLPRGKSSFDEILSQAIKDMQRETYVMLESLYKKHKIDGKILPELHKSPVPVNSSSYVNDTF